MKLYSFINYDEVCVYQFIYKYTFKKLFVARCVLASVNINDIGTNADQIFETIICREFIMNFVFSIRKHLMALAYHPLFINRIRVSTVKCCRPNYIHVLYDVYTLNCGSETVKLHN